jgi:hypothetical protein
LPRWNAHTDTYGNANTNAYDTDANTNAYATDAYTYGYGDSYTDKGYADPEAAVYTSSSAVAIRSSAKVNS